MDKNQKSVEHVGPSQSSSSRRVMWKVVDGEEEVFDSIVNYRTFLAPHESKDSSSTNSEHDQAGTSRSKALGYSDSKWRLLMKSMRQKKQPTLQESASKSSTSLALRYKPSHESIKDFDTIKRDRARGCWHQLFDRMRNKKLGDESSPSLALRYKPSHESLQNPRSKEMLTASNSANSPKLAIADLKLETCFFPPYQTAVVREIAPKFANRLCMPEDSESACSGTIELRIPVLKPSRPAKATGAGAKEIRESVSFISPTGARTIKRRSKCAASSSGNASKENGSTTTSTLPKLRQRQQELHRFRVQIEKRRLELLDLKIVRERADALRHEILFHKDLQLKHNQIKSFEDNNSSQA